MLGLSIRLIDQYQISVGLTIAIHKQQEQFHDIVIIQLTAQVVVNISQPCDCLVDWLIITRPMLLFPVLQLLLYHFDQFRCHASHPFFLTPDLIFLVFIRCVECQIVADISYHWTWIKHDEHCSYTTGT